MPGESKEVMTEKQDRQAASNPDRQTCREARERGRARGRERGRQAADKHIK